jgi:hypothetical protein
MPAHSLHLFTADGIAIAIAAAGGSAVIATAAASAIVADIQSDRSSWKADTCDFRCPQTRACGSLHQTTENDGPRHREPPFSTSASPGVVNNGQLLIND